jgi:hypothetical protein
MFGKLFSKSSDSQYNPVDMTRANEALADRLDHMMRLNTISARIVNLEVKTPVLVKNPTSIMVKKQPSLRRTFVVPA